VNLNQNTGLPNFTGFDGDDPTDPTGNPRYTNFPLKYYGNWAIKSATTAALLQYHDGMCGAWARFFVDILAAQGAIGKDDLPIASFQSIRGQTQEGFLIKGWTFPANPTENHTVPAAAVRYQTVRPGENNEANAIPTTFTYQYTNALNPGDRLPDMPQSSVNNQYAWQRADVTYTQPTAAQNNANPQAIFDNHSVIKWTNGKYYDPSYGKTYDSLADFENQSIAGFYAVPPNVGIGSTVMHIRPNSAARDVYELLSPYANWTQGRRIPLGP
jgi:hypothetical protein